MAECGEVKEDFVTSSIMSNTTVFSGDDPAMVGLFIILRPVFYIMVLKCMSWCTT